MPTAELTREYRRQRPRQWTARDALAAARAEIALKAAEDDERIRFVWEYDPGPAHALDQDWRTPEEGAEYRRKLEAGIIAVLCVRAQVPSRAGIVRAGSDWLADVIGRMEWQVTREDRGAAEALRAELERQLDEIAHDDSALWTDAPGMSSLGCIDVQDDEDGRAYRREVERDLAFEAGVIA